MRRRRVWQCDIEKPEVLMTSFTNVPLVKQQKVHKIMKKSQSAMFWNWNFSTGKQFLKSLQRWKVETFYLQSLKFTCRTANFNSSFKNTTITRLPLYIYFNNYSSLHFNPLFAFIRKYTNCSQTCRRLSKKTCLC